MSSGSEKSSSGDEEQEAKLSVREFAKLNRKFDGGAHKEVPMSLLESQQLCSSEEKESRSRLVTSIQQKYFNIGGSSGGEEEE